MKKRLIIVFCLIFSHWAVGQAPLEGHVAFKKIGDSLYKIKEYKSSAIAYSSALQVKGWVPIDDRWATASSWSLGNFPDSAFSQLNIIAASKDLTLYYFDDIINDKDFTPLHDDKRWQSVKDKMFARAQKNYLERSIKPLGKDSTARRMEGTILSTLLNNYDSAFALLNIVANESDVATYKLILYNNVLRPLHNDKRWQTIIEKVTRNLKCDFYEGNIFVPMIFSVDENSSYIKSDGLGNYFNGVDFIETSNANLYLIGRNKKDTTHLRRKLIFDLNHPVPGSGSIAHGIVQDNKAELHAQYMIDQTVAPAVVYDIHSIPIGATRCSMRTEMWIHINGIPHILQLGPWAAGFCGEDPLEHGGLINGMGTTQVKIIHNTDTTYDIIAPTESIGRLWDISNPYAPADKGLFYTGFIIHLQNQ